jgi:hypothetical protein
MKTCLLASAAIGVAMAVATPAMAATIYDLPPNFVDGNCVFNTTCGPPNTGNTFAAQAFSLAQNMNVTEGTFTVFNNTSTAPSSVNYLFLAADGANGLPGTVLFSGNSAITSRTSIGRGFGFDAVRTGFSVSGVTLGSGNYYLGLQAVSSEFQVYLANADGTGAAESDDGGVTFSPDYQGAKAVATSLSGVVSAAPEPATWAMMLGGFGMVGSAMRYRRRQTKVSYATA